MEFFCEAEAVRLRSHNNKFLCVKDDGRSVRLSRNGSAKEAVWQVVCISLDYRRPILRLKSRTAGCFLKATEAVALMRGIKGGGKVVMCWSDPMDFSLDWEPRREGFQVVLKSRKTGGFLRAHTAPSPWRNAVTLEPTLGKPTPAAVSIQQCFLWEVEPADAEPAPSLLVSVFTSLAMDDQLGASSDCEERSFTSSRSSTVDPETPGSLSSSTREPNERVISFTMMDDNDQSDEDDRQFSSITFQGNDVQDMTRKLEEATGLQDIIVCGKNPCDGEVFPLRLPLPPGNLPMRVLLVQSPKCQSPSESLPKPCLASKTWDEFARVRNMDFMGGARRIFKKALLDWELPRYPLRLPAK
ncbi:unnamed protein product [Victoria cruziana]